MKMMLMGMVATCTLILGNGCESQAADAFQDDLANGGMGPEMVVIPAGEFTMGSPANEDGRNPSEGPRHDVTIAEPFAMSRHEVTVADFRRFVEATGYSTDAERNAVSKGCDILENDGGDGDWSSVEGHDWRDPGFEQSNDHPVVCVSYNDARAYIDWLNNATDGDYRLPSEAEWEYAARAGTDTPYSFGRDRDAVCRYANGADKSLDRSLDSYRWDTSDCQDDAVYTAAVGDYRPNDFGLYDMHGNVWEWTRDCRNNDYEGAPTDGSAWRSGSCNRRVVRGGSWYFAPSSLRSASRFGIPASRRVSTLGFRLVQDL